MRTKLAALCLGTLALFSACADAGNDTAGPEGEDGDPDATATAAARGTPAVERAAEGEVNRPKEGEYVYSYESESTNAATPTASPRRSSPDAELISAVNEDGDVTTTNEKTTEGAATASSQWRWSDDRVVELSFETKTSQGSAGCKFDTPIEVLRLPIKKEKYDTQEFDGSGTSCDGQRTITIEDTEDTKDDGGTTWSTWRIRIETEVRATGVTNRSTIIRWFSPDLGKDIRTETTSELVNASGGVSARGESTSVLKTYPT